MKKIITVAAALLAVVSLQAQPQVIAHRGYHAKQGAARNTLAALENAQQLGVYGSECDVNLTSDGELVVIDSLAVKEGKTKEMVAFQKALKLDKTAVVVMDNDDINVIRAARNIESLSTLPVQQISTYEVVANAKVVLTKAAVQKIEEVYGE